MLLLRSSASTARATPSSSPSTTQYDAFFMETVAAAQPGNLLRDTSRAAGPTSTLRSDVAAPRRNGGVARRRNEPQTDAAPRRTSVIVTAAGRPYGGSTKDDHALPTRRWHSSAPESPQVADGLERRGRSPPPSA